MKLTLPVVVLTAAAGVFALTACKGETVVKIDETTKKNLDDCNQVVKDQKALISTLQEENTKLQTNKQVAEITLKIEGTALTVSPGKPGEVRPIDDKAAQTASKEFLDVVRKSKGAIQKCYEQALKKSSGLQNKPIMLTVSAQFANSGAYKNASFSPSLGDAFDGCIRAVATKWALPTNSPAMTFVAQVALTPT
jgi:hypothetical protein